MASTKPYADGYNVFSVYVTPAHNTDMVNTHTEVMSDDEIDAMIAADSTTFGGIMGSEFDVKPNLYGDDYADAIMSDLGL